MTTPAPEPQTSIVESNLLFEVAHGVGEVKTLVEGLNARFDRYEKQVADVYASKVDQVTLAGQIISVSDRLKALENKLWWAVTSAVLGVSAAAWKIFGDMFHFSVHP